MKEKCPQDEAEGWEKCKIKGRGAGATPAWKRRDEEDKRI